VVLSLDEMYVDPLVDFQVRANGRPTRGMSKTEKLLLRKLQMPMISLGTITLHWKKPRLWISSISSMS
jgi:hypothetical protein